MVRTCKRPAMFTKLKWITGAASMTSKSDRLKKYHASQEYRDNYDRIFGSYKTKMIQALASAAGVDLTKEEADKFLNEISEEPK